MRCSAQSVPALDPCRAQVFFWTKTHRFTYTYQSRCTYRSNRGVFYRNTHPFTSYVRVTSGLGGHRGHALLSPKRPSPRPVYGEGVFSTKNAPFHIIRTSHAHSWCTYCSKRCIFHRKTHRFTSYVYERGTPVAFRVRGRDRGHALFGPKRPCPRPVYGAGVLLDQNEIGRAHV